MDDALETKKRKTPAVVTHFADLGFTNRLALILTMLLVAMVAGGFYLAIKSIETSYTGALYCYTVIATPLGTALSVVLGKIVDKSKAENTGPDGTGIKFAVAQANGFGQDYSADSPPI